MDGAPAGESGEDADEDELGPVPCPVCGCEPGERAEYEHGDGVWYLCIPCACDCHSDWWEW